MVKGFNAERIFVKKFNDSVQRLLKLSNSIANKNNLASPLSEFLGIVTIGTLLWYGGQLVVVEHSLKATTFIGYIALAYTILTPAKAISKHLIKLKVD